MQDYAWHMPLRFLNNNGFYGFINSVQIIFATKSITSHNSII